MLQFFVCTVLFELEELSEVLDKDFEQKINVKLLLCIWRQFIKDFQVLIRTNSYVLIVGPSIGEILFDFLLEFLRHWSSIVESFD